MTESKKPPNTVTWWVWRATRPSTMSKMPAPIITSPAYKKHADVIVLVAEAEQKRGRNVDEQTDKGEGVRRNAGQGQPVHDDLEDDSRIQRQMRGSRSWVCLLPLRPGFSFPWKAFRSGYDAASAS